MNIDILNCEKCKKKHTNQCTCNLLYSKYGTVFDHTLEVMRAMPKDASFELQLAALYHDVGKNQETLQIRKSGKISFFDHEKVSAKLAKERFFELKLDNNSINYIVNLINHHMDIHKLAKVTDKCVRKFLRECNLFMEDLFILVDADCQGTWLLSKEDFHLIKNPTHDEIKIRARQINEELKKLSEKPFRYFNGNELMELFQINKPCKEVGILINIQNEIIDQYGYHLSKEEVINLIKKKYKNV